jgi:hypothetical protein
MQTLPTHEDKFVEL